MDYKNNIKKYYVYLNDKYINKDVYPNYKHKNKYVYWNYKYINKYVYLNYSIKLFLKNKIFQKFSMEQSQRRYLKK